MEALLDFRVQTVPAFATTTADFFGPTAVFQECQRIRRWVAFFTYTVTRAAVLEVTDNLPAESFVEGLQCYTGRRGIPLGTPSRSGSSFVLAAFWQAKELANLQMTEWNFIVALSSWKDVLASERSE